MIPLALIPEIVTTFKGLKRHQRAAFYQSLAQYGCSKTILNQLRPYLGSAYVLDPKERAVGADLLDVAVKVAEAKTRVFLATGRHPATELVMAELGVTGSPVSINAVIRSKGLLPKPSKDRSYILRERQDVDSVDCTGSLCVCVRRPGPDPVVSLRPASDSVHHRSHPHFHSGRNGLMVIGVHRATGPLTLRYQVNDPSGIDVAAVIRSHWTAFGLPQALTSDNGSEVRSAAVDLALEEQGVERVASAKGNPRARTIEGVWPILWKQFENGLVLRFGIDHEFRLSELQELADQWCKERLSKSGWVPPKENAKYGHYSPLRRSVRRVGRYGAVIHGGKLFELGEHFLTPSELRWVIVHFAEGKPSYCLSKSSVRIPILREYTMNTGLEFTSWDPPSATSVHQELLSCNLQTREIRFHRSQREAAKELGIGVSRISAMLTGNQRQAGGYVFARTVPGMDPKDQFKHLFQSANTNNRKKSVIAKNIKTGKEQVFTAVQDASAFLKTSTTYIYRVLDGSVAQCRGYSLRYKDY